MSTLTQFVGSGSSIKSIQTGYVGGLANTGTNQSTTLNEDYWRWDITVSAVTDITKCVILFNGGTTSTSSVGPTLNGGSFLSGIPTYRMLNTTTLRIMQFTGSNTSSLNYLWGRWQIIEYN